MPAPAAPWSQGQAGGSGLKPAALSRRNYCPLGPRQGRGATARSSRLAPPSSWQLAISVAGNIGYFFLQDMSFPSGKEFGKILSQLFRCHTQFHQSKPSWDVGPGTFHPVAYAHRRPRLLPPLVKGIRENYCSAGGGKAPRGRESHTQTLGQCWAGLPALLICLLGPGRHGKAATGGTQGQWKGQGRHYRKWYFSWPPCMERLKSLQFPERQERLLPMIQATMPVSWKL